eukprot:6704536-Prymnesium_polylepis.1
MRAAPPAARGRFEPAKTGPSWLVVALVESAARLRPPERVPRLGTEAEPPRDAIEAPSYYFPLRWRLSWRSVEAVVVALMEAHRTRT